MEMIKAVKNGLEGVFTPLAWKLGKPERHGWRKVGIATEATKVDVQQVNIGEKEDIKVVEIPDEDALYPTDEEIRAELKEMGVKVHPNLGTEKLREKYDANKK